MQTLYKRESEAAGETIPRKKQVML